MPFTEDLDVLLKKGTDLPTLPDVVLELRAALEDDMTGDRAIAEIVDRDPVITANILRVANSAAYNRGDSVTSVVGAIQRVGRREVRAICVVLSVVQAFSSEKGGLDLKQFWDHSAAVGRVAQLLSRRVDVGGAVGPDDIYAAGLLHDVGLLLLDQFFPEQMRKNLASCSESNSPLWQVEKQEMGVDHGQVGGLLVEHWQLPRSISSCVSGHHGPDIVEAEHVDGSRLIRAAESLCTSLGAGAGVEGPADADPFTALVELGMPDRQVEEVLTEIEVVGVSMQGVLSA